MAAISKEEYLKRYLSGDTNNEKKKKKKRVKGAKQSNSRIIDDDIDLKTFGASASNEQEQSEDEAPTVAEVVDERPEHVKRLEQYRKDQRWKILGKDKEEDDDISSVEYGVIASGNKGGRGQKATQRHDSDSDASLPRRTRHDSDSDPSPLRKRRHDSNSDASPPRKKRHDSDSDNSPAGRKRHDSGSDNSPPRKNKPNVGNSSSDKTSRKRQDRQSRFAPADQPARRNRHDSDSDHSPPRKQRHDSGSDQSPPRKGTNSDQSPPRRKRHDSDESPPRKRKAQKESDQSPPRRNRRGSDSDQSPPRQRKRGKEDDQSPPRRQGEGKKGAKPDKTLGGAKAGLSSAAEMKREAELLRKKEEDTFKKIDRDALGQDAQTVFRDKKSGKRRNLAAEQEEEAIEAKKKAEEDKKYQEWGQGLKQKEQREQQMQEYVHEASKPLARHKDDQDLDRIMRDMDRDGDPMAMFMKKKNKKEDPNAKPRYKGPPGPPNRFGILPGYRWDGVDRSNGFEKQIFTKMSEKKAVKEHAYKWSTEDM
ncbi:BUD13 homolog [Littorina saxatilis]|uniref:BUD13 homolog n=1 Tax=Littorina saxatilis TaxID=31220 RepID=A0AAN9GF02_9CAEN